MHCTEQSRIVSTLKHADEKLISSACFDFFMSNIFVLGFLDLGQGFNSSLHIFKPQIDS